MAEKTFVLYFLMHIWYNKNMNKDRIFQCDNEVTHGRGYVYSLKYPIVWCTKYRKQIFVNDLNAGCKSTCIHEEVAKRIPNVRFYLVVAGYRKETAESLDMELIAIEIMPDHVHLLVSCKPQLRLSDAIQVLKGNTARWLFLNYPEIKSKLWGGHLWNPSYFVATVSERTEEQIKTYISNQKSK